MLEIKNQTLAAVDALFGEPIKIFFKDGAQPVTITAILRTKSDATTNFSGGAAQKWQARVSAAKTSLYVDRGRYPNQKFDASVKVIAISRPNSPAFEVSQIDDSGHTRLVLHLGEAGKVGGI